VLKLRTDLSFRARLSTSLNSSLPGAHESPASRQQNRYKQHTYCQPTNPPSPFIPHRPKHKLHLVFPLANFNRPEQVVRTQAPRFPPIHRYAPARIPDIGKHQIATGPLRHSDPNEVRLILGDVRRPKLAFMFSRTVRLVLQQDTFSKIR